MKLWFWFLMLRGTLAVVLFNLGRLIEFQGYGNFGLVLGVALLGYDVYVKLPTYAIERSTNQSMAFCGTLKFLRTAIYIATMLMVFLSQTVDGNVEPIVYAMFILIAFVSLIISTAYEN